MSHRPTTVCGLQQEQDMVSILHAANQHENVQITVNVDSVISCELESANSSDESIPVHSTRVIIYKYRNCNQ